MTRGRALLFVAPLALGIVGLLLLPLLLDREKILELAASVIRERTGATLVVGGAVELELLPRIGISLAEVSLAMPGEEQPGLRLRSLQLGLRLLPLLRGRVDIQTLTLDGLTGRIAAGAEEQPETAGMSDVELDAFYARRRSEQAQATGSGAALAMPLALEVRTFRLTDSTLEIAGAAGETPVIVQLQRLEADDLNLAARPIELRAIIRLPEPQAVALELRATLRLDRQGQLVLVDTLALEATGIAPATIRLQATGEADLDRRAAELQLVFEAASTRGEGSVRYAALESPQIDANMHFNQFDPVLLALAGPAAAGEAPDTPGAGDAPLPLAPLRTIDTRAELSIDRALVGGHSIGDLRLGLRAADGVIRIDPLTAVVHGGRLALQATFDAGHNTATLTTSGTLDDVDIASALAATEVGPVATGRARLEWELASEGRTQNELLAGLAGPVKLATTGLVLRDIGIEGMLCRAVALANQEALSASFPNSTHFDTMAADIRLADGRARLQPVRAELPHIALRGTGDYELLSGDFKATFKGRLSPELESLDRACRVSKRLTAIDWPVDCAGNVAGAPGTWCRVDTGEILQDLGKHEAQRKLQKKAGKLLDKLFK